MKTYEGGCHCGNVRFEADIDALSAIECDCSHCFKKGLLLSFIPKNSFRLTKGDESTLAEYRFNTKKIQHLFCPICGVQAYGRGSSSDGKEMAAVNIRCIDNLDLSAANITPFAGKER